MHETRGRPAARAWRDPLTDPEYKALGDFRLALRAFLAFSKEGAEERGITLQQHQALLAIRAHAGPEAISVGELAQCLLIKHHSAVGLINRLAKRGLIARVDSPADKRVALLTLTPEGARILGEISVRNLGHLNEENKTLSALVRTLRRLENRGLWSLNSREERPSPARKGKPPPP